MSRANDPTLTSWVDVPAGSDFPIQNLPFGIFKTADAGPRVGVAIGEYVLDMKEMAESGLMDAAGAPYEVFDRPYLNDFMALGKKITNAVRERVSDFLESRTADLRDNTYLRSKALIPMSKVEMCMPVEVRDYTDFYSSMEHATNVGSMFRDPENALLPNWKHLPVGYHGRASSIVVSGTPLHRPKGQMMPAGADAPVYGPCKLLDFELEMAFIIGKPTALGESVSTANADEHIFGFVLFNDWSARDIQKWEYVPLGPFLGKNFGSSVSPWVVTLEALQPFSVPGYDQDPPVLPYLKYEGNKNLDVKLEVLIEPDGGEATSVCNSNYKYMYWNRVQQLAHHTVNGCNINVGDMYASGTISGPERGSFGSMLEISWRGTKPVDMKDGTQRKFINDGDSVIMRGYAEKDGVQIGFGEVKTKVLPAT